MNKIKYFVLALAASIAMVFGFSSVGNAVPPTSFTISTVDLHDGTIQKFGSTYYMYGTMYGCGYNWGVANTTWCGFGVSTSSDMQTWSAPTQLFSPNDTDPWSKMTWQKECGATGSGCFNPRMIQRTGWGANDDVYILWFNSPADYTRSHANAYNAMGCNGPTGGCGPGAGGPNGSYNKPALYTCSGNGDFSISRGPTGQPAIFCTMPGEAELRAEPLDRWGVNGSQTGGKKALGGLTKIEGPGVVYDSASSKYILTYSDPSCGYCTGTPIGYATSDNLTGPYSSPSKAGFGTFPYARRDFDPNSCGGQPRTSFTVDGVNYQWIDTWKGTRNEAGANVRLEKLTYTPSINVSGDGKPWKAEIAPFVCTS